MAHLITLIPGDGIGPEVSGATVRAVDATGVSIEWERVDAGLHALAEQGQLIPDDVFASLEMTRVGLKGPTATPIDRKSTRLNSSHLGISYAVFCLKNKNINKVRPKRFIFVPDLLDAYVLSSHG